MLQHLSILVRNGMDPNIPGQASSRKRAQLECEIADDSPEGSTSGTDPQKMETGTRLKKQKKVQQQAHGGKKQKKSAAEASNPATITSSDPALIPEGGKRQPTYKYAFLLSPHQKKSRC